jgi:hypothetical protein
VLLCSLSFGSGSGPNATAGVGQSAGDVTDLYRYKMNHAERGKFIIINNKTFLPHTHMNERSGTDEDASNLFADFKKLGFKVEMYQNRTKDQMLQIMIAGCDAEQ